MVSAIKFSGVSSGLDTAAIVDQLMGVEALTQNSLKRRLNAEQTKQTSLQGLNSALVALSTSAASFTTGSTWQQLTATSSNTGVTAKAAGDAQATNLSVTVTSTAAAAKLSFGDPHALTDVVADPDSMLTIDLPDGSTQTVTTGDGTLKSVLANLNSLKDSAGQPLVNAAAVKVGTDSYKVLLTAGQTGDGALAISGANLNLGTSTAVAGRDATLDLGAGITVSSKTNTFADIVPGVTLTVAAGTAVGSTADVAVRADGENRSVALQALVSQLNSVLGSVTSLTKFGSTTSGGGAWSGDAVIRSAGQQLIGTIYDGAGGVLNQLGVSLDRNGQFKFDSAAFTKAFAEDPVAIQKAIAGPGGFAERLVSVTRQLAGTQGVQSDGTVLPANGQLTQMLKQQQSAIGTFNDQIAAWDERLERKRTSLEAMYTRLETTMSRLNAQQSWLSAQLDSLSSSSSS